MKVRVDFMENVCRKVMQEVISMGGSRNCKNECQLENCVIVVFAS